MSGERLIVANMYRIPLRELKTKKIRIRVRKPREQVKALLSTHVLDTRKPIDGQGQVFYVHLDEAKAAELESWSKLADAFKKRHKDL